MKKLFLFVSISFFYLVANAQERTNESSGLIQFSGVVVTGDSLMPIPFVSVMIKNSNRGTISDFYGYFSFVAQKSDTIVFSSVGFKKAEYIIPDTLADFRYSLIQILSKDTVTLSEAVIYPWPSREAFREAFLSLQVPDDDLERARKNLERRRMEEMAQGMPMDGSLNYKYQMQDYQSRLYYSGGAPPVNLMNPLAWSKFIKAWQDGEFKKKK